jgi:hypothetical protein
VFAVGVAVTACGNEPPPRRHRAPRHRRGTWAVVGLTLGGLLVGVVAAAGGVAQAAPKQSDLQAQTELADKYAPVVRLVDSPGHCVQGEPYQPTNVNVVLGNREVALRGPWSGNNIVKVAPTATDLAVGLGSYNLDFPGDALSPGCTYANWAAQVAKTSPSTMYAHVVAEPSYPGQLALQYWFFYLFNDFNDKHEGDWEMVQLDFHASSASQALSVAPYETGYSQHEGAEAADWGTSSKLQIIDGTHPVVYPALGSHANYYSAQLFLGHSAAQGVGCDDTLGPSRSLRPDVVVLPQAKAQYLRDFPWLGYLGRWGERHAAFNNGPTGPNTKQRWTEPFTWQATSWRSKAFAIPDGGVAGHRATSFFCSAVAKGSTLLNAMLDNPGPVILVCALVALLAIWLTSRTTWRPAVMFRVRRRRSWGTLVTSAARLYAKHPRTFLGIGLLFIPLGLLAAGVQYLLFDVGGLSPLVAEAGDSNPVVVLLVESLGIIITLFGLTVVQAAVAYAVVELDEGRRVSAIVALRRAAARGWALVRPLAIAVVVVGLLSLTFAGTIVGAYVVVRWSLLAQAVMVGDGSTGGPLRQSQHLTRGHFWRTASVTLFVVVLCIGIGPFLGAMLLFITNASFDVVNIVGAVVDALLAPLAAIATTYLYFDLDVRRSLAAGGAVSSTLPAEA